MANLTLIQAIDSVASEAPMLPIVSVCEVLDRSKTNSVDSVVEEIERLMVLAGLECKASPCDILSALAKKTLLSNSGNPNHVNGLELGEALNKIMFGNHE